MWAKWAAAMVVVITTITIGLWVSLSLGSQATYVDSFKREPVTLGVETYIAQGSCQEPSSGCGQFYEWNDDLCSCVFDQETNCQEPASGCGEEYDWDSNSCSCVFDSSTSGSSCEPSTNGCGVNRYWDFESCNCEDFDGIASCQEPSGGCGVDKYWDFSECSCRSASSGSGSSGSSTGGYSVDRLAQVDSATLNCIKTRLTESEYDRFRYLVPTNDVQENELRIIEEKARICFEGYQEIKQIEEVSNEIIELPQVVEFCLLRALGQTAFDAVDSGSREPTEEEKRRSKTCFEGEYESKIRYQTNSHELDEDINSCLKLAVGEDQFNDIKSGSVEPSLDERQKVERCFGASLQPFQDRPVFELSSEIESCLKDAVGDARFDAINSGTSEPTDEERAQGDICFSKLNEDQIRFLPPPPEQVPYLVPEPDFIEIAGASQIIEEVAPGLRDRKFIFSGTGPPDSIVDIFVFSEPIVVTTKTDENGDWVYELNQPLEEGTHVAYATVRDNSGKIVRSSVFDFTVAAAEPGLGVQLLQEDQATDAPSKFLTYAFLLIAVGVVVAMGGVGIVYARNLNKEAKRRTESLGSERKGKGDSGTGTVN